MPPPPVPHPAAGTSHALPSAESIPPSTSDFSLTFRIHPVVVANIVAHYTRVNDQDAYCGDSSSSGARAAQPQRIFGCVIGVQHRKKVEIYNSFELVVDPASGALDRALFEKEQKRYKDLFPNISVKGWYSTGSHVQDTDMEIHRKLLVVDHSSVFLLLSPTINPSQMDLPITIYESDRRFINQRPRLIFVRPKHTIEFVKKALSTDAQSPNHLHVEETASTVIATMPLEEGEDAGFKHCTFMRMLFETPSGFAMFGIDDKVFRRPEVIFTIGDIKFENKSIAWDVNAGPGEDLGNFILKFCNRKGLIVQDLQLKQVIETKLGIQCWFNEQIVPELTWGLNFVLHEFVSEEKEHYHLPLSKELEKKIKTYGFNVSKRMIDRDFIKMVGCLKYLEYTSDNLFKFLHDKFDHCFSGVDISKTEYVEGIGNLLSSESVVMQYEMSVKEDIFRAIDSFWAAYKQIQNVWSCLRSMEAAAHLQETASDDSRNGVMSFVKRLPWPAVSYCHGGGWQKKVKPVDEVCSKIRGLVQL
ncbi:COP9 signalosome complex subunit 6a [Panicum miliaceum]|uniref:COP9 signalosome complex subunit 6a n=1 Tax=Panicum miliaceum TaxID=4540 RepID=A0A3L6SNE6_PANMI|nr:COP9 signalosome complex subunit 6a [Panicum miliaceum]